MSSYRRTEMTHPGSETIEQATARLPIQRVIQGTKRGSIESMIILSHRINDSYANYASEILDALLPHLNRPPAIAQVRHTTSALTAMNVLGDVFQWYKNHPRPSPASRITAARIHEYLDNFVYWTRRLLDGCHASPDAAASVNGYDTIGRFLYTLLLTPGDIPDIVSKNTTILGAAVDLATHLFQGFPIIHPRGRPSDPSVDQPDAASAVLFMLARDNPRGVVEVVTQGTICTTETFVERIVQRMRCYDCLSTIERFVHLSQDVSERMNVYYITALTFKLMESDTRMRDLFMEAKVPALYVSALAKQLRIATQFPDREERAEFLIDIALLPIRWWQMVESEGALARAEEMADGGMFSLIGGLLPYSRVRVGQTDFHPRSFTIGHALSSILPYVLYPNVLSKSAAAMEKYALPHIGTLPRDSPYRELLPSLLQYLRNCERMLPREEQEPLCDNMSHSSTHPAMVDGLHHIEKVCAGCHSVAYCSRKCQKEDWDTFHRDECHAMRVSYFGRKPSKKWYPYSYRRFHTSMLRYAFESVEVATTVLGSVGANSSLWRSYSPRKVNHRIDPLRVLDPMQLFYTDLDPWVGREAPLVPEYLRPRFDAFLRAFVASFQIPEYKPGSLRLVARVSPLGNEDVTLLLLLRQAQDMLTMKGSQRQVVEMVRKYTLREPRARSNYEILGSFAFIGPCRERLNLGGVNPDSAS